MATSSKQRPLAVVTGASVAGTTPTPFSAIYGATSLATQLQGVTARFVPESVKAEQHRKMAEHGSREK